MPSRRQLACVMCNHVLLEVLLDLKDDEKNDEVLMEIARAKDKPEEYPCPKCEWVPSEAFIVDPDDVGEDEKSPGEKPEDWWK